MKYRFTIVTWEDGSNNRMGEPQPVEWDTETFDDTKKMSKRLAERMAELPSELRMGYYYEVRIESFDPRQR